MSARHRYLVCYDIADPKRLRHVCKVCESYGSRLQFSVFEASLDAMMLASLKAEVDALINHDWDQVLFINMGLDDESTPMNIESLGLPCVKRSRVTII